MSEEQLEEDEVLVVLADEAQAVEPEAREQPPGQSNYLGPWGPRLVLVINGGNQEVIQEWKGDDSLILVVAREIEPCISVLLFLNVLEMER